MIIRRMDGPRQLKMRMVRAGNDNEEDGRAKVVDYEDGQGG